MNELQLLKDKNFKFNKKYGQNFIFDKNLLRAIVNDGQVNKSTNVLEIGCGAGTLTREIALQANKVLGYEIDENLKDILFENLHGISNVNLVFSDIMKENLATVEKKLGEDYVLIANLPYYITTPIIFKFLDESKHLKRMIIMVQLEVAKRLVAKENTEDYGAITVSLNYRANCEITRIVKRNMFTPQPNVDSAIVKIDFDDNKFDIKNYETLEKLIKCGFAMRRKTLANNLKQSFALSSQQIDELLSKNNLPSLVRGEALSVKQYVDLANSML